VRQHTHLAALAGAAARRHRVQQRLGPRGADGLRAGAGARCSGHAPRRGRAARQPRLPGACPAGTLGALRSRQEAVPRRRPATLLAATSSSRVASAAATTAAVTDAGVAPSSSAARRATALSFAAESARLTAVGRLRARGAGPAQAAVKATPHTCRQSQQLQQAMRPQARPKSPGARGRAGPPSPPPLHEVVHDALHLGDALRRAAELRPAAAAGEVHRQRQRAGHADGLPGQAVGVQLARGKASGVALPAGSCRACSAPPSTRPSSGSEARRRSAAGSSRSCEGRRSRGAAASPARP
jgi:hypothetical protein